MRARRVALVTLGLLVATAWADGPRRLRPDAELPAVALEADLGERRWDPEQEREAGDEYVRALAREFKLVTDPAVVERVEIIGHRIVTAAGLLGPRQVPTGDQAAEPMQFTFRVVEAEEINAFSVWDGNIYLTTGLLEFCQSDHELAAVMGHEVAHSTCHHLRDLVRRAQQFTAQQMLAILATAFLGRSIEDAVKVGVAVQLVQAAIMSGHSVEAETEADYVGCFYTYRAGYNPVGAVTIEERLHRYAQRQAQPLVLGIAQTHPWSDERAAKLEAQIRALGLPINRREVTDAITAGYRVSEPAGDSPARVELLLGETPVLELADRGDHATPAERAAGQVSRFNRALWQGLRSGGLSLDRADGRWTIGTVLPDGPAVLVDVLPGDAAAAGMSLEGYATQVFRRILARLRSDEYESGAV